MFACEALFICVIIRSASQSQHLLCLQELIRHELKIQKGEEKEDGVCRGKKTISLRKVKSEWGGEMAPALTGIRRGWFQCSIQVILCHSEPQWKSFVSFPTSVWTDEKFSALSSTRTLVRATWKSIELHVFTMHMCCVANGQPDASEIWLWKETSR